MASAESNTPNIPDRVCWCHKHAIDPNCPKHGIGRGRYLLNLTMLIVLVAVAVVAVFTAPAQGVI